MFGLDPKLRAPPGRRHSVRLHPRLRRSAAERACYCRQEHHETDLPNEIFGATTESVCSLCRQCVSSRFWSRVKLLKFVNQVWLSTFVTSLSTFTHPKSGHSGFWTISASVFYIQWELEYLPFEYRKHLNTKLFEVWISIFFVFNCRFVLCSYVLDQPFKYWTNRWESKMASISLEFKRSSSPVFKWHLNTGPLLWHPKSFRSFEYRTSLIFRSPR